MISSVFYRQKLENTICHRFHLLDGLNYSSSNYLTYSKQGVPEELFFVPCDDNHFLEEDHKDCEINEIFPEHPVEHY